MFSQAQDEYTKSRMKFAQEQNKTQNNKNSYTNQKKDPVTSSSSSATKTKKVPFHRGVSEPNLKASAVGGKSPAGGGPMFRRSPSRDDSLQEQRPEQRQPEEDILYNLIHGTTKPRNRTTSFNIELNTDVLRSNHNENNMPSAAGDLASFNEFSENFLSYNNSNNQVKPKAIDVAELESQICKPNNNDVKSFAASNREEPPPRTPPPSLHQSTSLEAKTNNNNNNRPLETLLNSTTENGNTNGTSLTNHLLSPHVMLSGKGTAAATVPSPLTAAAGGGASRSLAANFNKQVKPTKKLSPTKTDTKPAFPEVPSNASLKSLMSPAAFMNSSKVDAVADSACSSKNATPVKPQQQKISKREFQNLMIEMMQTDDEFVTRLHSSFLERLSLQS